MIHTFWCSLEDVFESEVYASRAPAGDQRFLTAWDVHGCEQGGIRPSCQTPNWFRLWKLQTCELQGNYSLLKRVQELHQAPGTYPSSRHTAHLEQTCLPELLWLWILWFGSLSQVKPEPWDTSCSFTPHTNYRGRAAGSQSWDNYPSIADPYLRGPGLPVSTPETVWWKRWNF